MTAPSRASGDSASDEASRLVFSRYIPLSLELCTAAKVGQLTLSELSVYVALMLDSADSGRDGMVLTSVPALAARWSGFSVTMLRAAWSNLEKRKLIKSFKTGAPGRYWVAIDGFIKNKNGRQQRLDAWATTNADNPVFRVVDREPTFAPPSAPLPSASSASSHYTGEYDRRSGHATSPPPPVAPDGSATADAPNGNSDTVGTAVTDSVCTSDSDTVSATDSVSVSATTHYLYEEVEVETEPHCGSAVTQGDRLNAAGAQRHREAALDGLVLHWRDLATTKGQHAEVSYGPHRTALVKLLTLVASDVGAAKAAVKAFFEDCDPFIQRLGWSVKAFETRMRSYLAQRAPQPTLVSPHPPKNGGPQGPPATPEFLADLTARRSTRETGDQGDR